MKIVLEAGIKWANRYANLLEQTAKIETDPVKKAEVLETAAICRKVPEHPAENFREAVQAFWFSHLLVEMEQMGCANTPGRVGQFLYPYYMYGAAMNATPNGRKKGLAFTDGSVSATPGTDTEGATALIKSAAQALDTIWYVSNHFNMKFLPSALVGPKGARNLINLVKTYFDYGGSHIQFNCVDRDTLEDAKSNPQDHRDLVVRVAGFSAYFTRLDGGVQDEIIKRTEYESV